MKPSADTLNVNFLAQDPERRTRRQTYVLAGIFTLVVAMISAAGAHASYQAVRHGRSLLSEMTHLPVIMDIRHFVFGADGHSTFTAPPDDQLHLLLLGIGGEGHDGAQLTDTILYANIDTKEHTIGLVSIPRDLAYPLGNGQFEKINAVNAYAEQAHPGEGARYTSEAFAKLLDVRIDHVVKIDFKGFVSFIDAIGGVDIQVEQTFTDWQYPTWDDKWMTVSFQKGKQPMDGQTALVFARSRHGNNGEGSDFARSKRQQLVILAAQEKLFSVGTLTDAKKLAALYSAVATHVQSDLNPWDAVKLAGLIPHFSRDKVQTRVLTDAPDGVLTSATVGGAFMLFPRKPDWSDIRAIAQHPYQPTIPSSTPSTAPGRKHTPQSARLEIKNGTTRTGFAAQIAAKLEKNHFDIVAFGNAVRRGFEETLIVDFTDGKKSEALERLRKALQAKVTLIVPPWITPATATLTRTLSQDGLPTERMQFANTDFLVILGETSYPLIEPSSPHESPTP